MKKNTNKGFTMVELLTTIVILGILMTVSIVAVNKVLENARNKYYVSLEKTVTLATKSYVQDNRNNLPKEIGGKKQIKLKTLQDNNYIKEVQDYNKNACDESSYVEVFKYSKTKYKYVPYLKCGKYNSPDHSMTYQSPKIEIVLPDSKVKKATATINITGQGDADSQKILAYSYVVYKNGKEVINSGSLEGKLKTEIKLNIKINKYTPGEIKVKVTATNINGQKTTKDSSKTYSDMSDPECKIVSGQNTVWTNKSVSITVGCDDGDGVGCAKGEYTKKFTSDTKEGTITISDLAGNETDCKVDVYIDKTAPKCTNIAKLENASGNNYTSGSWTNKSIYSNATCSDSGSGCSSKLSLTATGTTDSAGDGKTYDRTSTGAWTVGANGISTLTWTVYDKAGNSTYCDTITIKKGACTSTSTTWGSWSSCSKKCGTGTKTRTGTKYSTYDSSVNCGTTSQTQNCNTQTCCSSVTYKETNECSKTCGGGKKKREAYSSYNNTRCSSKDDWNGSSCNTQSCVLECNEHFRSSSLVIIDAATYNNNGDCPGQSSVYIHYCKGNDGNIYVRNDYVKNFVPSGKTVKVNRDIVNFSWYCDTTKASAKSGY